MNQEKAIQNEIDDAIFNFTIGESEKASQQLESLVEEHPKSPAWHTLAEIFLSEKDYKKALEAGEKAWALELKAYI